jgi:hypothetical protein
MPPLNLCVSVSVRIYSWVAVPEYYLLLVLIMDVIVFVCRKNIIFYGVQIASVDYGWNHFCLSE